MPVLVLLVLVLTGECSTKGVDVSEQALAAAKGHVAAQGIRNVELHADDAVAFLSKEPNSSADLVLFLEVAQWMERYREALAQIARVLKP